MTSEDYPLELELATRRAICTPGIEMSDVYEVLDGDKTDDEIVADLEALMAGRRSAAGRRESADEAWWRESFAMVDRSHATPLAELEAADPDWHRELARDRTPPADGRSAWLGTQDLDRAAATEELAAIDSAWGW